MAVAFCVGMMNINMVKSVTVQSTRRFSPYWNSLGPHWAGVLTVSHPQYPQSLFVVLMAKLHLAIFTPHCSKVVYLLVVHLGGLLKDRPGLRKTEDVRKTVPSVQVSCSLVVEAYVVQLLVFFIEFGEGNPECVRLPCGFHWVHSLDGLGVRVDDLQRVGKGFSFS